MSEHNSDLWLPSDDGDSVPAPTLYDDSTTADDELDPTAPPITDDGDEERDDGGISDGDRIVRIWVEDGRLTKVRISPHWWTKLERKPGLTLSRVFDSVLLTAHIGVGSAESMDLKSYEVELTPEFARSLPELSEESLEWMERNYEALHKRVAEQKQQRGPLQPAARETVGEAEGVKVHLNSRGHAHRVEIADAWLDNANAGQISRHVLRAAREAYDKFEPDRSQEEFFGEIRREYSYLDKVMQAILTPREQR